MKKQSTDSLLLPTAELSEDARSFGRSPAKIFPKQTALIASSQESQAR